MATVVVVQSDELAAWVGLAGVVVGVFLTARVDSLRKRMADRAERKEKLISGAFNILKAGVLLSGRGPMQETTTGSSLGSR
jgi:hypothetical protein